MSSEQEWLTEVMRTLRIKPMSADIEYLVAAHARLGNMAAAAEADADRAYAERKRQEALAFNAAMNNGPKISAAAAERIVEIQVQEYREHEIDSKERSAKINNLLRSVTEAINAIKYTGRSNI